MASLEEYRRKRNFGQTREPKGRGGRSSRRGPRFVVQKHDASRLHYDVRLEVDGVLKSWAVPKGPSTDPGEKRLAVPTEDHPIEYRTFEGVIPEEEYGGGTVIVWDDGTYRNLTDEGRRPLGEAIERGHVSVWLEGEKLRGGWSLSRMRKGPNEAWLLVKQRDEHAGASRLLDDEPRSVRTNRTVEEVAAAEAR
ncbi:MAG: 3'-phosphoesterase [Acidimicrobiales bacterium]|nr:3'-phosphoesterase [Acidimicrobiales bacterium]MBO0885828.1 3'-phosphoesterase [Acidimicrobiales bacterium]